MPEFIPGLTLCRLFFEETIRPLLDAEYPDFVYSAGMIGSGSEVLGSDTPESTDHHWGPRVMLFLSDADHARRAESIRELLRHSLPHNFRGYPTGYVPSEAAGDDGIMLMQESDSGPVEHRVELLTLRSVVQQILGIDPDQQLTAADWVTLPQQRLLELTAGAVFHDGTGTLEPLRQRFAYFPHDVWLYLLAAQWQRIGQEEPFMGRTGTVGDELGSQVVAARLVRDVMQLCFLMEKRYAPYTKWFGTAFSRLNCAAELTPILQAAIRGSDWHEREAHLSAAYHLIAEMHNRLGISAPLPTQVSPFHSRPYLIIHAEEFAWAIQEKIADEAVKRLPRLIGSVDQFVNSTDVLSNPDYFRQLKLN